MGACAILQQRKSKTQQFSGWFEIWLMRCKMTTRDKVNTSCQHSDLKVIFRVWQCVWHPTPSVWAYTLLTIMCMCGVERKSLLHIPHPVFCRKSDSAGELLPIPFTQGLGGSLVQSTLLTVIFTNPTATLLYYRSRMAFAPTNRFRSGNNVAKKCADRSCSVCRSWDQCLLGRWGPHRRSPPLSGAATRLSLRVIWCFTGQQGGLGWETGSTLGLTVCKLELVRVCCCRIALPCFSGESGRPAARRQVVDTESRDGANPKVCI